jgi:hypothetical protein
LGLALAFIYQQQYAAELKMDTYQSSLFSYIHGYRFTQLIYVAAELKIADLLQDGPKDSHYLAARTHSHELSLYRVLRALTTINIFRETEQGFELTEISRYLISDTDKSLRVLAIMRGEEVNWRPWGGLLGAVKTGTNPFKKAFGMDLFEYYEAHPASCTVFNEGMSMTTQHDIPEILRHYDFSEGNTFVEIGGGLGRLLFAILLSQPGKNGILYDMPHVVKKAIPLAVQFQVDDRCRIVGGDFFSSVPGGGDVYLMKRILHDWSDELAIKILLNCHRAMATNGKIVVFETMIQDEHSNPEGKVNDVHMMMVTPGGKERTGHEFRELFDAAGFALGTIKQVGQGVYSNLYAIEGQKH